jgi:hypothetical protein
MSTSSTNNSGSNNWYWCLLNCSNSISYFNMFVELV